MKGNLWIPGIILFDVLCFTACTSMLPTKRATPSFDVKVMYENDTPIATLAVEPKWSNSYLPGYAGFECEFHNNTAKVIKIIWSQSSVSYHNNSYVPFIDGQKYIDSTTPMPPTPIISKGVMSKTVYSSGQPYFSSGAYGGWSMNPIFWSGPIQIMFCIQSGEKEEYITATITENPISNTEK
jgi:hypothetical protein